MASGPAITDAEAASSMALLAFDFAIQPETWPVFIAWVDKRSHELRGRSSDGWTLFQAQYLAGVFGDVVNLARPSTRREPR